MGLLGELIQTTFRKLLDGTLEILAAPAARFLAAQGKLPAMAAAALPRVVIVGEGGSGKSTILKQMLARAASGGRVPVWVSLASLPLDGPLTVATLIDFLVEQASARLGVDEANRAFFESLVREGAIAIGFDALDECGALARRQKVRGLIADVARQWERCQVFVTSRPEALRETPLPLVADESKPKNDEFLALAPVPFTRDDVAPFLRAAFEDGEKLAQQLLVRTGIEALLETPLTLTLVGLVARTAKGLPETRTPLFARCVDTVCETWEDAKGAQPPADGLDAAQRLDVLRRLGWEAQCAGGDVLSAREARTALARTAEFASPARTKTVVDGLARRNLLLRAETVAGGNEVQSIRFAHPQFREYLAGAHFAEEITLDPKAAAGSIAPHWFDIGWLEVLRFAVVTLENEPALRDEMLRAAHAAADPYRDLLRRPDFLVARLLMRLYAADPKIVEAVAGTLEQVALNEPALRDEAARTLLALVPHRAALPMIRRFAEGSGAARAFPDDPQRSRDERMKAFQWRVRALDALARAENAASALALLPAVPIPGLNATIEMAELRARLGDRKGALAAWKQQFDDAPDFRALIAASMDKAGEQSTFDDWLASKLAEGKAAIGDATLALERGIAADHAAVWTRLFAQATGALTAIDASEIFAPKEASDAVYAAVETDNEIVRQLPARRALLEAALGHPSLTWFVGGRIGRSFPELARAAIERLTRYVVDAQELPYEKRPDHSRLRNAVAAVCEEPDDALAVPALLELLRHFDPDERFSYAITNSLARRGHAAAGLQAIAPMLEIPPGVDDGHPDDAIRRREMAWSMARRLAEAQALQMLDTRYRSGEPEADAQRLMTIWYVSGVAAQARAWFDAVARDGERGRRFLQALAAHERDTFFTDAARHALYGSVFDTGVEAPRPWTLEDTARAFESAREHGSFIDERDNEVTATTNALLGLLSQIAGFDRAVAQRHADAWIKRTLQSAGASKSDEEDELADRLRGLSSLGLAEASWIEPVVAVARGRAPAARIGLVEWLNASV